MKNHTHTGTVVVGNAIVGLLVMCALFITWTVVRREYVVRAGVGGPTPEFRAIQVPKNILDRGLWMGSTTAAVVVVEFGDFQCPFCADVAAVLAELRDEYDDRVAVLYRHLPLSRIHPHAYDAAVAAECAAAQGAFERFHDVLFAEQPSIGRLPWEHFAKAANIRSDAEFKACLGESWPIDGIADDVNLARQLGIDGTPAIIVDGRLFEGSPPRKILEAEVKRALSRRVIRGPP